MSDPAQAAPGGMALDPTESGLWAVQPRTCPEQVLQAVHIPGTAHTHGPVQHKKQHWGQDYGALQAMCLTPLI